MLRLATDGRLFSPAKAVTTAEALQAGDDEGWTYVVVHDPKGVGYSFITVYDADGTLVGKY